MRSRGFLLGGTAGRTTLNGEGLQHEDGHSHVLAATIRPASPTILRSPTSCDHHHDGLRRMVGQQEDVYYYLTVMNENYPHPAMREAARPASSRHVQVSRRGQVTKKGALRVQLLGSGSIFREVIAAADLLKQDWNVDSDLWSCPSFTELAREGYATARHNLLDPTSTPRRSHVEECLAGTEGPVIAATDYMRIFADEIRSLVPRRYVVLGTDGFGRSDTREKLRHFFEGDRRWIALAALKALAAKARSRRSWSRKP